MICRFLFEFYCFVGNAINQKMWKQNAEKDHQAELIQIQDKPLAHYL